MVSIVTKFIVIYNDIVAVSGPYMRCESFPRETVTDGHVTIGKQKQKRYRQ